MSFWQNVETEREYKNISRKELAKKADFAVSGISLGLSHDSIPSADIAVRIAKVLGVSVEYLVTGKESSLANANNTAQILHILDIAAKLSSYDLETVRLLSERLAR